MGLLFLYETRHFILRVKHKVKMFENGELGKYLGLRQMKQERDRENFI